MSLTLVNTSCTCSSSINTTSNFLSLSIIDYSSEVSSVVPSFVWVAVLLILVLKFQVLFPVCVSCCVIDSSSEVSSVVPSFVWVDVHNSCCSEALSVIPIFVWVAVRNTYLRSCWNLYVVISHNFQFKNWFANISRTLVKLFLKS